MSILTKKQLRSFQTAIWNYYYEYKREMPWRGEGDPYRVLVSEIMLQQTQVTRVTLKYQQFIKRFPSFKALSRSSLSSVLKVWSGLGYNRRAIKLYKLSKIVQEKYKGVLPSDYEALISLPGIGKGTAGSVRAFVFNQPEPFVETNIRTVYIHFFYKNKEKVSDKDIYELVGTTIDKENPREWYYALMDYGAMLKNAGSKVGLKSTEYRKQPAFKGSNREVRGLIVKYLSKCKKAHMKEVRNSLHITEKVYNKALQSLLKDEIIQKKGTLILINNGV